MLAEPSRPDAMERPGLWLYAFFSFLTRTETQLGAGLDAGHPHPGEAVEKALAQEGGHRLEGRTVGTEDVRKGEKRKARSRRRAPSRSSTGRSRRPPSGSRRSPPIR